MYRTNERNDSMRRIRRHRKQPKNKICILLILTVTVVLLSLFRTERALRPYAQIQAEHFAEKTANEIIEKTVCGYLEKNKYKYNDFACVLYDSSSKASSIETLPYTINKVQSELTLLINRELEQSGKKYTDIPLGTLTDSFLLTGKGPKVRIRVAPIGVASVELRSRLEDSGINQTVHKISAVIRAKMSSSTPLYSFEVVSEFEFILAENVIVGSVPNIAPYTIDKNMPAS